MFASFGERNEIGNADSNRSCNCNSNNNNNNSCRNSSSNNHCKAGRRFCHIFNALLSGTNDKDHKIGGKRQVKMSRKNNKRRKTVEEEEEEEEEDGEEGKGEAIAANATQKQSSQRSSTSKMKPQVGLNLLIMGIIQRNNLGESIQLKRDPVRDRQHAPKQRQKLSFVSTNLDTIKTQELTNVASNKDEIKTSKLEAKVKVGASRERNSRRARTKPQSLRNKTVTATTTTKFDSLFANYKLGSNDQQQQQSYCLCLLYAIYSAAKYVQRKLIKALFLLIALID